MVYVLDIIRTLEVLSPDGSWAMVLALSMRCWQSTASCPPPAIRQFRASGTIVSHFRFSATRYELVSARRPAHAFDRGVNKANTQDTWWAYASDTVPSHRSC